MGQGPVDWAIKYEDGRIIGVTEAKKSELKQGVARNIIQLQSSDEVEKIGGEHKLYVDERAPYILDLSKNASRKKLAVRLDQLFKRLLWTYEQSLPGNEGNRIKTL
ncbi:hypothetical protein SeLEV6574_g05654 [Synchytrium endobioticum]|uniref:Uncharacterized protein n=1 Tax=Synchytrium endobioticum TaxID=286115 RepID=A0A507CT25_9FUNG|nr:hypothetical protein SeLEV6574_g05654 [Synchytrium endobioticum]